MVEPLERITDLNFEDLVMRATFLQIRYSERLKSSDIKDEDIFFLLYLGRLDTAGINFGNLPKWDDFSSRFKIMLGRMEEGDYAGRVLEARFFAERFRQFYQDPLYRFTMLEVYQERFKPLCEQINAEMTHTSQPNK